MDIFGSIWDAFVNFINGLITPAFDGWYNILHGGLEDWFSGFEGQLNDAFNILVNGSDMNSHLGATAQLVNEAITPIAYTILACGFVWDLYSMWQRKQDNIDFKDIVKVSVRLLVIKSMIPILPAFLDIIRNTVSPVYVNILTDSEINFQGLSGNIASTILTQEVSVWNFVANTVKFAGGWLVGLLLKALGLYVYVIAYIRDFEFAILNAMSAIPLIFAVYQDTKDVPRRFLFAYGQVVLQGLIMIVVFIMYNSLLVARAGEGVFALITSSAIAFMAFKKSAEWAGKVLGQ